MDDSQLAAICDVINGLPEVLLNVESFNFLDEVEGERLTDSCFRPQALATKDEDILVIELANTEGLPRVLEVREHDPLLARNREELC